MSGYPNPTRERAIPQSEGRLELWAARQATLRIFRENPHGERWTDRLVEAIRHEHAVAERWGL